MYKVTQEIAKTSQRIPQNLLSLFHPSYTIKNNFEIKMYLYCLMELSLMMVKIQLENNYLVKYYRIWLVLPY